MDFNIDAKKSVIECFIKTYRKEPLNVEFTPFRICPVGAHTDHQLGKITGFAINKGIYIAYGAKQNGIIEISSMQFLKRAQWHVLNVPEVKQNDWADMLRGATIALNKRFRLSIGLCAVINGELPIGGLSSSAAVIITFLSALCKLNNIVMNGEDLITIAQEAENNYVGVSTGRLDQSCEVYCKKDNLLFMDLKTKQKSVIPVNKQMKPFKIAIFFSGLSRSLVNSKYNLRVDECKSAAYYLQAISGYDYGDYKNVTLSDVPENIFNKYKNNLPLSWAKRAQHWYDETNRVIKAVEYWKKGNLEGFGKTIFESGYSSINLWESGSPELIKLFEIMRETEGIYGGRFSGAGFKGCCLAIIDPLKENEILLNVRNKYLNAFPLLKNDYYACICETENGVEI